MSENEQNISCGDNEVSLQQQNQNKLADERYCWVCFATDEDADEGYLEWVQPCHCKGTTKWVCAIFKYPTGSLIFYKFCCFLHKLSGSSDMFATLG